LKAPGASIMANVGAPQLILQMALDRTANQIVKSTRGEARQLADKC
jgi:hypothetical protein